MKKFLIELDGPIRSLDNLSKRQRSEESIHAFTDFGCVAGNGCVDCAEGKAELENGVESGGVAEGESVEVVWLFWCLSWQDPGREL